MRDAVKHRAAVVAEGRRHVGENLPFVCSVQLEETWARGDSVLHSDRESNDPSIPRNLYARRVVRRLSRKCCRTLENFSPCEPTRRETFQWHLLTSDRDAANLSRNSIRYRLGNSLKREQKRKRKRLEQSEPFGR